MSISAYTKTCASHTPGNKQLILIAGADVTSVTLESGEVTAMVQDGANKAVIIPFDSDGLVRMEEQTATKGGLLYVVQKLEFHLSKSSKALGDLIKSIADASPCGILAIVTDNNNSRWLLGSDIQSATAAGKDKGLYMESGNFTSGSAMDDEDGDKFVITLTGMYAHGALHIESTKVIDVAETGLIASA